MRLAPTTSTRPGDHTHEILDQPLGADDAAVTLTADLTGASWLTLVTDPGTGAPDGDNNRGDSTDWARPLLA